jgi:hypothetical protein
MSRTTDVSLSRLCIDLVGFFFRHAVAVFRRLRSTDQSVMGEVYGMLRRPFARELHSEKERQYEVDVLPVHDRISSHVWLRLFRLLQVRM